MSTALPGLSALTAYAQLANVGLGLANIGLTTAVLVEARKQTKMLRELQADVKQIRDDVKDLLETTQRIDVNVALTHLREGLKHALRSSSAGAEVDLVVLARLADEALHLFYPSLGGPINVGGGQGLVLAAEARELAESVMHLLFAARRTALEAHNLGCGGDPARVVRDDLIPQTLTRAAETAVLFESFEKSAVATAAEVSYHLHKSWSFHGDTHWYWRTVKEPLTKRLEEDLGLLPEGPNAKVLLQEVQRTDAFKNVGDAGPAAAMATTRAYCDVWVARTDAGLLWRLQQEVLLQQDQDYWSGLDPWSHGEEVPDRGGRIIQRDLRLSL